MKEFFKKAYTHVPLFILVIAASILRIQNLGYSDYQGDEIKALFPTSSSFGNNIFSYLLDQRKGPGQFIITYLIKFINSSYTSEFITRLPFALAGIFSIIFFYKLINLHFGKKIAFYSSIFLTTNGFFIAFSRIVQYQAFMIFFVILALYYLTLAIKEEKYRFKGIYLGLLCWSISILFHYDGIFIAPFATFLLLNWYKENTDFKTILKAGALAAIPVIIFYVPFLFTLSQKTVDYWSGRITGDVSSKLSSSLYLFSVYQPIYIVHFYVILFVMAIFALLVKHAHKYLSKIKFVNNIPDVIKNRQTLNWLILWLLLPFVFLELIVYIPGTHIFNYLLPMTVLLSYGILFIEEFLQLFKRYFLPNVLSFVGLTVFFSFLFVQSYAIFVDNTKEYPFEGEYFLLWELPQPNPIYHLSIFGFPYYRNWEGIKEVISNTDNNGFYSTNERESISRYYVPLAKSTDNAGHHIYIINPQSFTGHIYQDKAAYWAEKYPPVFTFSKGGQDLVRIYYMEPGTSAEIQVKGF